MGFVDWFLTQTIFGIAILIVPIYGIAYLFKKFVPGFPSPFAVSAVCFVLLIATVPSYPRYKFEKQALSMLERSPHAKIIAKTYSGDITEPITWIRTPLGFVHVVYPDFPLEGGGYYRVIMRYDEEPQITIENPDCKDFTIMVSAP